MSTNNLSEGAVAARAFQGFVAAAVAVPLIFTGVAEDDLPTAGDGEVIAPIHAESSRGMVYW